MVSAELPELRLGLVGCGRLAERGYLEAAEAADAVRIVAVADPAPGRCKALTPGTPGYRSAEELIAAGDVDAVLIASPAAEHLAGARAAAGAGLAALVQKPPADEGDAAAELAMLSPAPWLSFNKRFDPGLVAFQGELPADGELDIEISIQGRRGAWDPYVVRDDALLTLGPHLIDLAGWLTGAEIEAVRSQRLEPLRAELELRTSRGRARLACRMDRFHHERVEASRPGGARIARRVVGGLPRYALGRLRGGSHNPLVATLTRELEAFARAINGGPEPHPAPAAAGVPVMRTIDAARRSIGSGGAWIELPVRGSAA